MVAGNEVYNELILAEIGACIVALLSELCGGRDRVNEFRLLKPDTYGKLSVCLDQIIFQGHLEQTDVPTILRLSKLKPS